jgi:hypothetical protein
LVGIRSYKWNNPSIIDQLLLIIVTVSSNNIPFYSGLDKTERLIIWRKFNKPFEYSHRVSACQEKYVRELSVTPVGYFTGAKSLPWAWGVPQGLK